jgi:DNA-binding response OmpR family regulator
MRDKKVALIVEDDPSIRVMLTDALTAEGYAVIEASNGLSGLRLAERHRPAVILLDQALPELAGLDMLEELQRGKPALLTPVIVVSATADQMPRACFPGVRHWIQKPFDLADLLEKVRQLTTADEVPPPKPALARVQRPEVD